jgi:hypothetical protein
MHGDLIASIPVVGLAIKALRARDSFRDVLFAEKLTLFIKHLDDMPPADRLAMRERFESDGEARAAGNTLLLVLERLTDFDKPALLAFLLACFARGQIDALALRRLAVAVDLAFPEDLREFLDQPLDAAFPVVQPEPECRGRLVAAGLTEVAVGATWDSDGAVIYPASKLGRMLHDLLRQHLVCAAPSADQRNP